MIWPSRRTVGFVAAFMAVAGCGSSRGIITITGSAGTIGDAGTTATAGATGDAEAASTAGASGTDGTAGAAGSSGTSGAAGTAGTTGAAGTTGTAGTTGAAGAPPTSAGCGQAPGPQDSTTNFVKQNIMVSGVDPAFTTAHPPNTGDTDSWTMRNYFVRLPMGYDPLNNPAQAFPVDISGTGCGGDETVGRSADYALPSLAAGQHTQTEAIQVSLSYLPSNSVNTCPMFADDYPNSPEPQYLDAVINDVSARYCVNKNKIFINGYEAGADEAILAGCTNQDKVRAFGVQIGGYLAPNRPTCMNKPTAAMFVVGLADTGWPIGPLATAQNDSFGSALARDELLKRNGCVAPDFLIVDTCPATASVNGSPCAQGVATGDTYSNVPNTMWNAAFPKCHVYTGCPAQYPVVWCPLDVNHGNGPNPMGADCCATVEGYRRQGMWQFFTSLPDP